MQLPGGSSGPVTTTVVVLLAVAGIAPVAATALDGTGATLDGTAPGRGDGVERASRPASPTANGGFAISEFEAPDVIRPNRSFTVTATVTNTGSTRTNETIEYSFEALEVEATDVTLSPGESTQVSFRLTIGEIERATGQTIEPGTYIHGIRNESGTGRVGSVRVTPDVDFDVEEFEAPTDVTRSESFVVAAVVENPGDTSITRTVTYQFSGAEILSREVTIAGGERKQVAFEMGVERLREAGLAVETGRTYSHGIVAEGGDRSSGELRVVRGATGDPSAVTTQDFAAPETISPGEEFEASVSVQNVVSRPFEGEIEYRIAGVTVVTESLELQPGEEQTIRFPFSLESVESALGERLSRGEYEQSLVISGTRLQSRPIVVERRTPTTSTPEADPTPTPEADPTPTPGGDSTPTPTADDGGGSGAECRRGFFTNCGGTFEFVNESLLTLLSIVLTIVGILVQMIKG